MYTLENAQFISNHCSGWSKAHKLWMIYDIWFLSHMPSCRCFRTLYPRSYSEFLMTQDHCTWLHLHVCFMDLTDTDLGLNMGSRQNWAEEPLWWRTMMLRHYEPWDFVGVSLVCSDPDLIKESQSCSAKNMDPSHSCHGSTVRTHIILLQFLLGMHIRKSHRFRENHQRLGWRYPQEVTRFIAGHREEERLLRKVNGEIPVVVVCLFVCLFVFFFFFNRGLLFDFLQPIWVCLKIGGKKERMASLEYPYQFDSML